MQDPPQSRPGQLPRCGNLARPSQGKAVTSRTAKTLSGGQYVISSLRLLKTPGPSTGPACFPPSPASWLCPCLGPTSPLLASPRTSPPSLESGQSGAVRRSPTRTVLPSTVAMCLYRVRAYVDSCCGRLRSGQGAENDDQAGAEGAWRWGMGLTLLFCLDFRLYIERMLQTEDQPQMSLGQPPRGGRGQSVLSI